MNTTGDALGRKNGSHETPEDTQTSLDIATIALEVILAHSKTDVFAKGIAETALKYIRKDGF